MKFKFKERRVSKIISLKDVLPEVLKEFKIQDDFSLESLKKSWVNIMGNIIAAHSMPERIEGETLFIIADHSIYSNEIVMKRREIIKKLNSLYTESNVKEIKVYIKNIRWNR